MKNAILEDFDPNAKMRQLGSPLDGMPQIEKPRTQVATTPAAPVTPPQNTVTQPRPVMKKTAVKPTTTPKNGTRPYVRRTFDFYEDQIAYLTKASLEDRLAGGDGSMNAMVRDAIDAYIATHRKK
jgi:hypothetical protein